MKTYLEKNNSYWERGYKGYANENIESFVFRPYGRIIQGLLEMDDSAPRKLLDFGCGSGAPTRFFRSKNFDVYGVDISEVNIQCCKKRMPDISNHFAVIEPKPDEDKVFWGGEYDLIIAFQSLYYFSNTHLNIMLQSLHNQMKPGGILYATMIGTKCWCYDHSVEHEDGLRKFEISSNRVDIDSHYVNFINDDADLIEKFSMFKKQHVGFHSERYREDEGTDFHYTFVGQKE